MRPIPLACNAVLMASLVACSASDAKYDAESMDTGDWDAADEDDGAWDTGWSQDPPPEQEDDEALLAPSQTDVYVFIANPDRDTVTRVGVTELDVRTIEVGHMPRDVRTSADYDRAAVFNAGDDSVMILDAHTLETTEVPVRDNLNVMQMSPEPLGQWVVLWHDRDAVSDEDPPENGLVSYNEVSFVDTISATHYPMAVGFNPRGVRFTPDASLAVIVSDATLALVDLTETPPVPEILPIADEIDPPPAEEVALAPDGTYAFVRQFGANELLIVDLLTRDLEAIPVGANPTDLDLTPDGASAVVVSRDDEELWRFDVADPFAAPEVLDLPTGEALGSLKFDPTGTQAVVYTTATRSARYASWNLADDEILVRSLVKPIADIAIAPTGSAMLVAHTLADAPDADTSSPFYGEHALTMVDLTDYRTNPLKLPAPVDGWATSTNGTYGYFIMKDQKFLEILHFDTLIYDQVTLSSIPIHIGTLPDLDPSDGDEPAVWVNQEHELGRLSFYDPDDQVVQTITGFELNSHIEEE